MIEYVLKTKNITGENHKRAVIFYMAIRELNKKSPLGATRSELYRYLNRRYHPDEISRILQFLKYHNIVTTYDQTKWITLC